MLQTTYNKGRGNNQLYGAARTINLKADISIQKLLSVTFRKNNK